MSAVGRGLSWLVRPSKVPPVRPVPGRDSRAPIPASSEQGLLSSLLNWARAAEPSPSMQQDGPEPKQGVHGVQQQQSTKKPRLTESGVPAVVQALYVTDLGFMDLPVVRPKDQDDSSGSEASPSTTAQQQGCHSTATNQKQQHASADTCHSQTLADACQRRQQQQQSREAAGAASSNDLPQLDQLDQWQKATQALAKDSAGSSPQDAPDCLVTPCHTPEPEQWSADTELEGGPEFLDGVASQAEEEALSQCLGAYELQGGRPYQEDRMAFVLEDSVIHIGLFDGHAGQSTSSYLQAYLLQTVCHQMQQGLSAPEALREAFTLTNSQLRRVRSAYVSGSTATVIIADGPKLVCANAGDSPAFIVNRAGQTTCLTMEHNPNTNEEERLRVQAAGGRIEKMHWGERYKRVLSYDSLSGLAMTRAFGDFNFTGVICDPHVHTAEVPDDALYLVVASDGLTEQWTIEGAAASVLEFASAGCCPTDIAVRLSHRANEKGSRDNISVVVMDLQQYLHLYHASKSALPPAASQPEDAATEL